jgi:LuxR family maltose regulon positive regulatory protein
MELPGRDALITTKLGAQARGQRSVVRDRLCAQLDSATEARLVLVSAPAGFGKSTMLAEWLGQSGVRGAWVSLDARDNDIVRFARYLAAAAAQLAGRAEDAPSFDAPSFDEELAQAGILDCLAATGRGAVLVLDD